jgi:hypothetical protein
MPSAGRDARGCPQTRTRHDATRWIAHVYWTGYNNPTGRFTIGRANLDGTGVQESIISGATGFGGLAVDATHIYWEDEGGIGRADLDGTGVTQGFVTGLGVLPLIRAGPSGAVLWSTAPTCRSARTGR